MGVIIIHILTLVPWARRPKMTVFCCSKKVDPFRKTKRTCDLGVLLWENKRTLEFAPSNLLRTSQFRTNFQPIILKCGMKPLYLNNNVWGAWLMEPVLIQKLFFAIRFIYTKTKRNQSFLSKDFFLSKSHMPNGIIISLYINTGSMSQAPQTLLFK